MFTSFLRLVFNFGLRSEGSVAPMLALAAVPLVAAVGAGGGYSLGNAVKAQLQASLDVAVLTGARDGTANWTQTALNFFNANPVPFKASVKAPAFSQDSHGNYTGTTTATVSTTFLNIMGLSTLNINVASAA